MGTGVLPYLFLLHTGAQTGDRDLDQPDPRGLFATPPFWTCTEECATMCLIALTACCNLKMNQTLAHNILQPLLLAL